MEPLASRAVELHPGDCLSVDGPASMTFVRKSGRVARLLVTAARDVAIKQVAQEDLGDVVPSVAESSPG